MISRFGTCAVAAAFTLVCAAPPAAGVAVEVHVEVTEVDNSRASRLGFDWSSRIRVSEQRVGGIHALGTAERLTGLQADLLFLEEQGAAELLANPTLVTDSGTTARFHAGGQIPYVTSTALGASHVQFKPYGVALSVRPQVLESGLIRMKITASVSSPDETVAAVVSGASVPALLEREVSANVTLRPEMTMALAGLVQTRKDEVQAGVPFLRRVPLLGAFFRWRRTGYRRTTVVIFVTPRVIEL